MNDILKYPSDAAYDSGISDNPRRIIDVHGHYVYGIDDGARDIGMSLEMVRAASAQGVSDIFCTSHSWGFSDDYRQNLDALRTRLNEEGIQIRLHSGTETACYRRSMPEIIARLDKGLCLPLGNSDYVLMEFDTRTSGDEVRYCAEFMAAGNYRPVIAHMERYLNLYEDENTLNALHRQNIPIQINAFSLAKEKNELIRSFARKLLDRQMVTFLGSDAHRTNHRPPDISSGAEYIYRSCSREYADAVCFKNAGLLLGPEPGI